MNSTRKKHFYNRFGFGISFKAHNDESSKFNPAKTLSKIARQKGYNEIPFSSPLPLPKDLNELPKEEKKRLGKEDKKALIKFNNDWIAAMSASDNVVAEKMTLFWHDHFACKPKTTRQAANQINLIRRNALGNFKSLTHSIAKDPAMLLYLNNQQNRKNKPNENFARELMELFTLGIGNYTEADIKEAARAFTGWRMNGQGKFQLQEKNHDFGSKTVFGKTGNWSGENIIDMIFEQKACADFISKKIAHYIIGPKISVEDLTSFSNTLYQNDYEILPLLTAIAESKSFNNEANFGNDLLSPVELLIKMERGFGMNFQKQSGRIYVQKSLGQFLLQPPNVSGWPTGQDWIDTSTLTLRLRLSRAILLQQDTGKKLNQSFAQGEDLAENLPRKASKKLGASYDISEISNGWGGFNYAQKVQAAALWMLPNPVDASLIEAIAAISVPAEKETEYALALVAALPEYQLK